MMKNSVEYNKNVYRAPKWRGVLGGKEVPTVVLFAGRANLVFAFLNSKLLEIIKNFLFLVVGCSLNLFSTEM